MLVRRGSSTGVQVGADPREGCAPGGPGHRRGIAWGAEEAHRRWRRDRAAGGPAQLGDVVCRLTARQPAPPRGGTRPNVPVPYRAGFHTESRPHLRSLSSTLAYGALAAMERRGLRTLDGRRRGSLIRQYIQARRSGSVASGGNERGGTLPNGLPRPMRLRPIPPKRGHSGATDWHGESGPDGWPLSPSVRVPTPHTHHTV